MNQIPYRDPATHYPSLVRIILWLVLSLFLGVLAMAAEPGPAAAEPRTRCGVAQEINHNTPTKNRKVDTMSGLRNDQLSGAAYDFVLQIALGLINHADTQRLACDLLGMPQPKREQPMSATMEDEIHLPSFQRYAARRRKTLNAEAK